MHAIDPRLMTALVAMCIATLMVHAGISKRRLAWRPRRTNRERSRRP